MTESAERTRLLCRRKIWRWLKQSSLVLTGIFLSASSVMACDGSLPPLSTLAMQKALVESLQLHLQGVREEEKVGQRSGYDVIVAEDVFAEELENLWAMEACTAPGKGSPQSRALKARVKSASDHLDVLKSWETATQDRFQVGEVTQTDVALVRAFTLKAELRLAKLKQEAGR